MTTARQEIRVDALGRPLSAYRDDNPVDLSKLGRQSIVRFSEVLHDDEAQGFYVSFRDGAPAYMHHTNITVGLLRRVGYTDPESWTAKPAGRRDDAAGLTVLFKSYAAGIRAEQAVLAFLMQNGDMA